MTNYEKINSLYRPVESNVRFQRIADRLHKYFNGRVQVLTELPHQVHMIPKDRLVLCRPLSEQDRAKWRMNLPVSVGAAYRKNIDVQSIAFKYTDRGGIFALHLREDATLYKEHALLERTLEPFGLINDGMKTSSFVGYVGLMNVRLPGAIDPLEVRDEVTKLAPTTVRLGPLCISS